MQAHYVDGYGRSGSTSLGRVLAAELGALCVGEITNLARPEFVRRATCSCGGRPGAGAPSGAPSTRVSRLRPDPPSCRQSRGPRGGGGSRSPAPVLRGLVRQRRFSAVHPTVPFDVAVRVIAEEAGGSIVDTSKTARLTANRPRLLAAAGFEVVQHLSTRPLPDVVRSHRAARSRQEPRPARGGAPRSIVTFGVATSRLAARWCALSLRRPLDIRSLGDSVARTSVFGEVAGREHVIAGNRDRHQGG